jgi:hypothetical protein
MRATSSTEFSFSKILLPTAVLGSLKWITAMSRYASRDWADGFARLVLSSSCGLRYDLGGMLKVVQGLDPERWPNR